MQIYMYYIAMCSIYISVQTQLYINGTQCTVVVVVARPWATAELYDTVLGTVRTMGAP